MELFHYTATKTVNPFQNDEVALDVRGTFVTSPVRCFRILVSSPCSSMAFAIVHNGHLYVLSGRRSNRALE